MFQQTHSGKVASLPDVESIHQTCSTPKLDGAHKSFEFDGLSDIEVASNRNVRINKKKRHVTTPPSTSNLSSSSSMIIRKLPNHLTPFLRNTSLNDSGSAIFASEHSLTTRKVIRKGQDWILFKPHRIDTLYGCILMNSDAEVEVSKWLQLFHKEEDKAVMYMIQFILDVCGFEDFNTSDIFDLNRKNYMDLVKYLQSHPPSLQVKTGKYLLNTRSDWGNFAQQAIFKFMQTLILTSHTEDILYSEKFAHLFAFILSISRSCNRSLRHTGVTLTIKIYSSALKLYTKLCKNKNTNNWKKYNSILVQLLLILQSNIELNCHLQDVQLSLMKITFLEEMSSWFQLDPSLLSSTKYFNRLMRLVQDSSKSVRSAALKTCHELITTEGVSEQMNDLINTFTAIIGNRVYDIDYSIAISAVQILTIISNRYGEILSDEICDKIISLVYGKHGLLAKSAGKFLINKIANSTDDNPVLRLALSAHIIGEIELLPLLIDATLDFWPIIDYWPLLIDWLLSASDICTVEMQHIIMQIMSESVQQCITGKCKIVRMKPCNNETKTNSQTISKIFITKMSLLLKKYKDDSKCVEMLVNILLFMDLQEIVLTNGAQELDAILSVLRPIFVKETNQKTLDVISKYFYKLYEPTFTLKHKYINKIKTVQLATKDALSNFIQESNKESVEFWMGRLLALINHHDLKEALDFNFLFDLVIFMEENKFSTKVIEYGLKICYHFLRWQLTTIIELSLEEESMSLKEDVFKLKTDFERLIDYCFKILQNISNSACFAAFECICEVYLKFHSELKWPSKQREILCELIPVPFKSTYTRNFMSCVIKLLFDQHITEETLRTRRIALGNVINLIFLHIIEITEAVKLYTYYDSHNTDYGDIFDSGFKVIYETNPVTNIVIILQCLIYKFTQLMVTNSDEEINIEFQSLSKRFQLLMNRWVDESCLLINMGIKYSISSETHYQFLNYLKYFAAPLSMKEKKILVNKLLSSIPEKNHEHAAVKAFIWYIKYKKTGQQRAGTKSSTTSSITESFEIEDESESISSNGNYEILNATAENENRSSM